MELPNGITTSYTYNNLNRLTNLTHKNSSGDLLSSYTYTLAPNGRRTAVAEQSRTAAPALSPIHTRNITYQYDNLNRLVAETSTCDDTNQPELTYTDTYSYDLTGNRLNKTHTSVSSVSSVASVVNYSYNDNDQLLSETKESTGNSPVVTLYDYDTNGSLISKTSDNGDSYTYTYNLQNRLSTAIINRTEGSNTIALTTEYTYNQSGIRVGAKSTPSGSSLTTEKLYLLDNGLTGYAQVLEEKNDDGDVLKSYLLGDDIISQTSIHNSSFVIHNLLSDGHGSTRLLADASGTIAETYNYDAYGVMCKGNPSVAAPTQTNMLYSGEQFDPNLQMQYLRARYYDPNNGTFNRLDSFSGNNSDPQSLHKYAYCHNNPVSGSDPSGMLKVTHAVLGMVAHLMIQMHYMIAKANYFELAENLASSTKALASLLSLLKSGVEDISADASIILDAVSVRPDITNRITGEIFEIKPANTRSILAGRKQLLKYQAILVVTDPLIEPLEWHAGKIWFNTYEYTLGNGVYINTTFFNDGIIRYTKSGPWEDWLGNKNFVKIFHAATVGLIGSEILFQLMQARAVQSIAFHGARTLVYVINAQIQSMMGVSTLNSAMGAP